MGTPLYTFWGMTPPGGDFKKKQNFEIVPLLLKQKVIYSNFNLNLFNLNYMGKQSEWKQKSLNLNFKGRKLKKWKIEVWGSKIV